MYVIQGHHFSMLQHETEKLRNDIEKMRNELRSGLWSYIRCFSVFFHVKMCLLHYGLPYANAGMKSTKLLQGKGWT